VLVLDKPPVSYGLGGGADKVDPWVKTKIH
jgi:hypothetical protein